MAAKSIVIAAPHVSGPAQRAVVATAVSWLLLWGTSSLNVSSAISTTAVNCIVPKVNVSISGAKVRISERKSK